MYRVDWKFKPIIFLIDMIGSILFFWTSLKKKPENPKRILVVRLDYIGNMRLTPSFLKNLKKEKMF